jgi:hypothetical protein
LDLSIAKRQILQPVDLRGVARIFNFLTIGAVQPGVI